MTSKLSIDTLQHINDDQAVSILIQAVIIAYRKGAFNDNMETAVLIWNAIELLKKKLDSNGLTNEISLNPENK